MRILSVISSVNPETGGPALAIRMLYDGLRELGHDAHAVCLDAPESPWLEPIRKTLPIDAIGPASLSYQYCPRLAGYLERNLGNYDAAVIHGLWQHKGLATWRAARQVGVPYLVYPHGMLDPWFRRRYPLKHLKKWLYWPWAEYRVLRDAAAVCFTCEEERLLARQSFWLYQAREVVTGYGTATPPPPGEDEAAFFQSFPSLRGSRYLLFLGRLHPKKNLETLIQSFRKIAQAAPNLKLVVAGTASGSGVSDDYRRQLEALAEVHAPGRILFTGMLLGPQKWGALRSCEALVLPSHQENFGIVVAEALACSRPALVSTSVNIWREIVAARAGWAEAPTPEGTDALLSRWISLGSDEVSAMRGRARACYEKHFQEASVVRALEGTIQDALRSRTSE